MVQRDEGVRSEVQRALQAAGHPVRADPDGRGVRKVLADFQPEVVILDVVLVTGPDGYAVARSVRAHGDIPVLFLTDAADLESRLAGFAAGADDYLVKPFWMSELLARVAVLGRRGAPRSAELRLGDLVLDESSGTASRAGTPLGLTRTQYQLLFALAQHPGQVLSKHQLLTQVWGFEAFDVNVVEVHLSALRRKLEAHGPRLIHTVHGSGYVFRPSTRRRRRAVVKRR